MVTAVPAAATAQTDRVLDPIARTSEVLFGLIMAPDGRVQRRHRRPPGSSTLLVGMIACNTAVGLVDAVMFPMSSMTERGHNRLMIRVLMPPPPSRAHRIVREALPPVVASILSTEDFEKCDGALSAWSSLPARAGLARGLARRGCRVLLVFFSTFPVVIPFLLFSTAQVALRVSNLIAIVMLFCLVTGWDSTAAIRRGDRLQHGIARPGAGGDCDRPRG